MKLSPLQLLHSHFKAFSIVSEEYDLDSAENQESPYPSVTPDDVFTKVELGTPDEVTTNRFAVTLGVGTRDKTSLPYKFAVQIEGFFTIDSDEDIEAKKRLVVVNGASMLFGFVREQLLSMTMRHRNGPLLLPSLDFRSLSPAQKGGKEKELTKKKRKPAARNSKTGQE